MPAHKVITFQLAPSGVALVVGGVALVTGLAAAGGYLLGSRVVTPSVSEAPGRAGGAPPKPPGPSLPLGVAAKEAFTLRLTKTVASEEEAKALQAALKDEKGIDAVVVPIPPIFALEMGSYPTRREAAEASAALAEKGVETVVVTAAPATAQPAG